jgi:hypothetical protein
MRGGNLSRKLVQVRRAWLAFLFAGCQVIADLGARDTAPTEPVDAGGGASGSAGTFDGSAGDGALDADAAHADGGSADVAVADADADAPPGCPPPPGGPTWPDSTSICVGHLEPPCAIFGQDADYLAAPPDLSDLGETVLDQVAGLLWEETPPVTAVSRSDALAHCGELAAGSFAGASDWRLPTMMELSSLLDTAQSPLTWLPASASVPRYWTSDSVPVPGGGTLHLAIDFGTGEIVREVASQPLSARCVSGKPAIGGQVIADPGCPGVLSDARTGLEWQATSPAGEATWSDAIVYCEQLDALGGGWRLPSLKELLTLMTLPGDAQKQSSLPPALAGEVPAPYWSSSPAHATAGHAFAVSFALSSVTKHVEIDLMDLEKRVRCVRP